MARSSRDAQADIRMSPPGTGGQAPLPPRDNLKAHPPSKSNFMIEFLDYNQKIFFLGINGLADPLPNGINKLTGF